MLSVGERGLDVRGELLEVGVFSSCRRSLISLRFDFRWCERVMY